MQLTSVSSTVGVKHSPRLVVPGSVADTCLFSPPLLVIRTQTNLVWLRFVRTLFSVLLYQCLPVKLSLSPLCLYLNLGRMDVNKSLFLGLTDTKVVLFYIYLVSSAFLWHEAPSY